MRIAGLCPPPQGARASFIQQQIVRSLPPPQYPYMRYAALIGTGNFFWDSEASSTNISGASGTVTSTFPTSIGNNQEAQYFNWTSPITGYVQFDCYGSDVFTFYNTNLTVLEVAGETTNFLGVGAAVNSTTLKPMPTSGAPDESGGTEAGAVFWATSGRQYRVGVSVDTTEAEPQPISYRLNWGVPVSRAVPIPNNSILVKIEAGVRTETPLPGSTYNSLAYNEAAGQIWVLSLDEDQAILVLDATDGSVVRSIPMPAATSYEDKIVYYAPDAQLWTAGYGTGWAYNGYASDGAALAHFGDDHDPYFLIDPDTGILWGTYGTNVTNGALRAYNKATGALIQQFPTGYARPQQLVTTGDGLVWFIAYNSIGTASLFSLTPNFGGTAVVEDHFTFPKMLGLAYDGDTNSIWIATPSSLQQFSISADDVINTYSADTGGLVDGTLYPMHYESERRVVWVHSTDTSTLNGYNTSDGTLYQTTETGDYGLLPPITVNGYLWGGYYEAVYMVAQNPIPPEPEAEIDCINDRDVWLQSFTLAQRFEDVTVQFGTVVNQAQTQGAGIVIGAAKSLSLLATSQYFIVRGTKIEPPYITFTPSAKNLAGTPSYSVTAGSVTLTANGDKRSLAYGGMESSKATIAVSQDGITDQVTVVKLVDGSTTITTFLTNEREGLLADSLGNVLNYNGASGGFRVFRGATEVTADCAFAITGNPTDLIAEISNRGLYAVYGMTSSIDSADIVMTATYEGTTYTETFTVYKNKATAGSAADPLGQTTSDGRRLPVNIMVTINLDRWIDGDATSAVPGGVPVINDRVTEYNPGTGFKETRFWNASEWVVLNALIDGNLLVTGSVGAKAIATEVITAIVGNFQLVLTERLEASTAQIDILVAELIQASRAEIETLVAQEIDAVNGNFDTLTINGTQIDPNSINTGHVVNNAISVPATATGSGTVSLSGAGDSVSYPVGTVAYVAAATIIASVTVSVTGGLGGPGFGGANYYEIFITKNGSEVEAATFTAPAGQITSATFSPNLSVGAETATWGFGVRVSSSGGAVDVNNYSASFIGVMK